MTILKVKGPVQAYQRGSVIAAGIIFQEKVEAKLWEFPFFQSSSFQSKGQTRLGLFRASLQSDLCPISYLIGLDWNSIRLSPACSVPSIYVGQGFFSFFFFWSLDPFGNLRLSQKPELIFILPSLWTWNLFQSKKDGTLFCWKDEKLLKSAAEMETNERFHLQYLCSYLKWKAQR